MTDSTAPATEWYSDVEAYERYESASAFLNHQYKERPYQVHLGLLDLMAETHDTAPDISGESFVSAPQRPRVLSEPEERVFAIALARSVRLISKGKR